MVNFGTKENLVILGLWTAENDAAMDLMERILPAGLLHYLQVLLFFHNMIVHSKFPRIHEFSIILHISICRTMPVRPQLKKTDLIPETT